MTREANGEKTRRQKRPRAEREDVDREKENKKRRAARMRSIDQLRILQECGREEGEGGDGCLRKDQKIEKEKRIDRKRGRRSGWQRRRRRSRRRIEKERTAAVEEGRLRGKGLLNPPSTKCKVQRLKRDGRERRAEREPKLRAVKRISVPL